MIISAFKKSLASTIALLFISFYLFAQAKEKAKPFTRQDTLRGSIGEGRQKWDVLHYDITVEPSFENKTISGINTIKFLDSGAARMQIDLQEPMTIDSIISEKKQMKFTREGNVYWVTKIVSEKNIPFVNTIVIYFHGKPREAVNPPWDGGWIWKKDRNNNPFVSVACQGLGASVWYPCKDSQSDEPDSGCNLRIIVPNSLAGIGNGRLIEKTEFPNGKTQYDWEVKNPINNYNIIPYIGKYTNFSETYNGLKGSLDLNYWVLDYNVSKAQVQFGDVKRMLQAFEYWFGPYPFYEDGYKLVEAPHLGMEHQSSIAYGNQYKSGYLGMDLSLSGWGLKWDFIIVHESGHEWFGNNITTNDIADMWVHEGFTNYSETLFTEYFYGKKAAEDYISGLRLNINNDRPIIGKYGVNNEGSEDMYYKGANMIHTIRQVINNDSLFRRILTGLNKEFYHKTVTSYEVESYISNKSGFDFSKLFDQYLRTTDIPALLYYIKDRKLHYRWTNCVDGFNIPVKIKADGGNEEKWLNPTDSWKTLEEDLPLNCKKVTADINFYIKTYEFNQGKN